MREEIQKEALDIAMNNKRGALSLPMRSGKTLIGLRIASNFKNVLVVYPNKSIKDSWVGDSIKFNIPSNNLTFSTYMSLKKHDLNTYDCVILDEVHDCSINNWEHLQMFPSIRLYALSGTMPNKGDKYTYLNELCPIIYRKTLDETVGTLQKDYKIYVHLLNPSTANNIKLKSGRSWSDASKIRFWQNKYECSRNFKDMLQLIRAISDSPTKYNYLKKLMSTIDRSLIFVETSLQADNLNVPTYHSKNKNSEQNLIDFQQNNINQLATINQLKAGVTFTNLNNCLILHCYSSNNKAAQKIGRCLNYVEGENAIIHIIGLNNTIDLKWIENGLNDFDKSKIIYKNIN